MLKIAHTPRPHRAKLSGRFFALYFTLIAVPMLGFLLLGFHSLQRQWLRLTGPQQVTGGPELSQVAAAIETRTLSLAQEWFADAQVHQVRAQAESSRTAEDRRRVQALVDQVRKRHPGVKYAFLVRDGIVQFPRMQSPARLGTLAYALHNDPSHARMFTSLLSAAPPNSSTCSSTALHNLRRAAVVTGARPLKALALLRTATCLNKSPMRLQAWDSVDTIYRDIAVTYGDEYDPSDTPYELVATTARERAGRAELERAYQDLVNGRWELAVDQVCYYRDLLRKRIGGKPPREDTTFLDRIQMTQALQHALVQRTTSSSVVTAPGQSGSEVGKLYSLAFSDQLTDYQAYYADLPTQKRGAWWGVILDLSYVQRAILPELGVGETVDIAFTRRAAGSRSRVAFQTAFAFWELTPSTVATQRRAARVDSLLLLGAAVSLALIALGAVILYRHIMREREVNRLRGDIISGISHELKTPITLIRLYSETLLSSSELHQDSLAHCNTICDEAQRLTRLVDEILDFTPVERGTKRYSMHPGDIGTAIEQIVALVRPYFSGKGFTISSDIGAPLPAVSYDSEALRSALLNLIDNAVKYSGKSTRVQVEAYCSDNSVVVAVQDYGIGIDKKEQQKIFQPYYRVDIGVPRGGCGLGLALVQHIMAAHGGRVRVESEPHAGSRFELIFPVCAADVVTGTVQDMRAPLVPA